MSILILIKPAYHSNLFWQWNLLRFLSILWWKIAARRSSHYMVRLVANCLQRHRVTNICLSSLWIAIERLGLNCNTRCLHWNTNRDTIHTLSHSITKGAAWKNHCLLLKSRNLDFRNPSKFFATVLVSISQIHHLFYFVYMML